MLTLISITTLRLAGKLSADDYIGCLLIAMVEFILTGIFVGAFIESYGA